MFHAVVRSSLNTSVSASFGSSGIPPRVAGIATREICHSTGVCKFLLLTVLTCCNQLCSRDSSWPRFLLTGCSPFVLPIQRSTITPDRTQLPLIRVNIPHIAHCPILPDIWLWASRILTKLYSQQLILGFILLQ